MANNSLFNKDGFVDEAEYKAAYPGGRTTLFTEENRTRFLKYLREMGNITQACRLARLGERMVASWLDRGKSVLDMVNTMDDDSIMDDYGWFNIEAYYQIADRERELEGYILATAKKGIRWEAAAFLAERKSAENIYGMRQAMAVTGNVEHTFRIQEADGDDWKSGGRSIIGKTVGLLESGDVVDTTMKESE